MFSAVSEAVSITLFTESPQVLAAEVVAAAEEQTENGAAALPRMQISGITQDGHGNGDISFRPFSFKVVGVSLLTSRAEAEALHHVWLPGALSAFSCAFSFAPARVLAAVVAAEAGQSCLPFSQIMARKCHYRRRRRFGVLKLTAAFPSVFQLVSSLLFLRFLLIS